MWVTRMYARFRHLVHEFSKFGIVGGVAYAVDTALFAVLLLAMESMLAKTVATALAATIAFLGNRFWTWRHRRRSGLTREYVLYFTLNAVGLAISLAFLGVSHHLLGRVWPVLQTPLADLISANVLGLAAGTVFRFWSYRRFVFLDPAGHDRTDQAGSKHGATDRATNGSVDPGRPDGPGRADRVDEPVASVDVAGSDRPPETTGEVGDTTPPAADPPLRLPRVYRHPGEIA